MLRPSPRPIDTVEPSPHLPEVIPIEELDRRTIEAAADEIEAEPPPESA